jgi:hypothetical protein
MGHTSHHVDPIEDLEVRVRAMRRLGVTRWGDLELGPEPQAEQDEAKVQEQRQTLEKRETERRSRLQFAASGGPRLGDRHSR